MRADLEAGIGRRVTDRLWSFLLEQGWVDDVVRGARGMESLVEVAGGILRAASERSERAPRNSGNTDAQAWARSVLVAEIASADPDVVAFRRDVLGDQLISHAEVPGWIEAQEKNEVPVVWATVPLEGEQVSDGPITGRPTGWSARVLSYAGPGDEWVRLATTGKGVLERLRRLSVSLADFYAWTEAQAVIFTLTDVLPWIAPIRAKEPAMKVRHNRACPWAQRITLDIDPSVTPAEVAEAYKEIRNRQGRRRRISEKHAQLAIHKTDNPSLSWSELMALWNRVHPEWAYAHVSNLRRDVARARAQVIGAVNPLGGW